MATCSGPYVREQLENKIEAKKKGNLPTKLCLTNKPKEFHLLDQVQISCVDCLEDDQTNISLIHTESCTTKRQHLDTKERACRHRQANSLLQEVAEMTRRSLRAVCYEHKSCISLLTLQQPGSIFRPEEVPTRVPAGIHLSHQPVEKRAK